MWALARVAMALADFVPSGLLVVFNTGYFLLLAVVIGTQLLLAGIYQKLGFVCAIVGLGIGEFLFLTATLMGSPSRSLEMVDVFLLGLALLMINIGLRAIPAFTGNWLTLHDRVGPLVPST